MLDWWTRNFKYVALPVLVGTILLSWLSPSLNYEFFCKGDNSCFREWVSALSGWVAVAAAIVTVHFLKRQIEEANRHQSENIELTVMRSMAISRSFFLETTALSAICNKQSKIPAPTGHQLHTPSDASFLMAKNGLLKIKAVLTSGYVTAFEREIGLMAPSFVPLEFINQAIRLADEITADFGNSAEVPKERSERFWATYQVAVAQALNYALHGTNRANEFIDRWAERLSEPQSNHSRGSR